MRPDCRAANYDDIVTGAEEDAVAMRTGRVHVSLGRKMWPAAVTVLAADFTLAGAGADANLGAALVG